MEYEYLTPLLVVFFFFNKMVISYANFDLRSVLENSKNKNTRDYIIRKRAWKTISKKYIYIKKK